MTTISVSVDEAAHQRIAALAKERDTEPEALLRLYVDYLAAGGEPLPFYDAPSAGEIVELLSKSSAWAWLHDEPDVYSTEDGEPCGVLAL